MSFEADLDKFMQHANAKADETVQKVTVLALQGVMTRTAVDTGRARANWNLAVGEPDLSTTEATDFGSRNAEALGRTGGLGVKDENIYLSNNLPYALALEYGHSQQSPLGMVRITLIEIRNLIAAGRLR